jgi:hypothetical protein
MRAITLAFPLVDCGIPATNSRSVAVAKQPQLRENVHAPWAVLLTKTAQNQQFVGTTENATGVADPLLRWEEQRLTPLPSERS